MAMEEAIRTDEELALDLGRGDARALEALLARHWGRAVAFARRAAADPAAAEDCAQEAFVRLSAAAARFRPGAAFRPWLDGILANVCADARRARGRRSRHEAQAAARREGAEAPEGERRLAAEELAEEVRRLPADVRAAIVLRFHEDRSLEEVAAALGCPVGTASSRIRRGLERLRASIGVAGVVIGEAALVAALSSRSEAASGAEPPAPPPPAPGAILAAARAARWKAAASGVAAVAGILVALAAGPRLLAPKEPPPPPVTVALAGAAASPPAPPAAPAPATPPPAPPPPLEREEAARPAAGPASPAAPAGARRAPEKPEIGRAQGRVVAAESGLPIAGARVMSYALKETENSSHEDENGPVETGADGTFEIAFVGGDEHPRREDHDRFVLEVYAPGRAPADLAVEPAEAGQREVRLVAGGAEVAGTVVERTTGTPLPGRKLKIFQKIGPSAGAKMLYVTRRVETGADGTFTFESLRTGDARLSLDGGSRAPEVAQSMKVVASPEPAPIVYAVDTVGRATIALADPAGNLLEGRFEAIPRLGTGSPDYTRRPWRARLVVGTYVVRAAAGDDEVAEDRLEAGLFDAEAEGVVVTATRTAEVRLTADRSAYGSLSGRVTSGGAPLEGAVVSIRRDAEGTTFVAGTTTVHTLGEDGEDEGAERVRGGGSPLHPTHRTGADGRFAFEGLPPGPLEVQVAREGHETRLLHGTVGPRQAKSVEVALAASAGTAPWEPSRPSRGERREADPVLRIRGRALVPPGAALPGEVWAYIEYTPPGSIFTVGGQWRGDVQADGTYEVEAEGVAPGASGRMALVAPGFAPVFVRDLRVPEGGLAQDLRLSPGLSVAGRAVASDGTPLAGVRVEVRWPGFSYAHGDGAESDVTGAFVARDLPEAEVVLELAKHEEERAWRGKAKVDPRQKADVGEVRLEGQRVIRLR